MMPTTESQSPAELRRRLIRKSSSLLLLVTCVHVVIDIIFGASLVAYMSMDRQLGQPWAKHAEAFTIVTLCIVVALHVGNALLLCCSARMAVKVFGGVNITRAFVSLVALIVWPYIFFHRADAKRDPPLAAGTWTMFMFIAVEMGLVMLLLLQIVIALTFKHYISELQTIDCTPEEEEDKVDDPLLVSLHTYDDSHNATFASSRY